MSRSCKLRNKPEVWPADLAEETLISYGSKPTIGQLLDITFQQAGLTRKTHIEISMSISAMPLVQRGLGVALVDGLVPRVGFNDLIVRPFRPMISQDIVLSTNSSLPGSRFGREFSRDVKASIADLAKQVRPDCRLEKAGSRCRENSPGDEPSTRATPKPLLDESGCSRKPSRDSARSRQHARQGCAAIGDDRLAFEVAQRHGTAARQPMRGGHDADDPGASQKFSIDGRQRLVGHGDAKLSLAAIQHGGDCSAGIT